jgi:DNA-binding response OmpR family regulator
MALRVLVVEDNADLATMLGDYLEGRGHRADFAADGAAGLRLALGQPYDVIVLDRALPRLEGTEVSRRLREQGCATPILMLTARDTTRDKIAGLDAGADDYMVKPFELAEVEARLQALHRRASGKLAPAVLRVGDLEYDPAALEARRAGRSLALNPTTRKLLEFLMRESGRIVPREELEYLIWGDAPPDADVLRAHMHKLRDAVDREFDRKLVHTFRGAGYRLAELGPR